jgi:phage FluMu protein Com
MKAIRCASCGKYYDEDKYSTCPHCKADNTGVTLTSVPEHETHDDKKLKKHEKKFKGIFGKKNKDIPISKPAVHEEIIEEMPSENPVQENPYEHQTLSEAILNANSTERFVREKTQGYYKLSSSIEPAVGWLTCIKGESTGETFKIKAGKNSIGSSLSSEISLAKENGIARDRHAQITFEPKKRQFFIQNGDSEGLIYVNNELVTTFAELKNYDIISLGETELIFIALCGEKFTWDDYTV